LLRSSVETKAATAENNVAICCIHKNLALAVQYHLCSAKPDHPDGGNDLRFCLEHSRGAEQNSKMAAEFERFPAACGSSQAKVNHNQCLRLLGHRESFDAVFKLISHPRSLHQIFDIFHVFLDNTRL
jgi:TPR repeat protein